VLDGACVKLEINLCILLPVSLKLLSLQFLQLLPMMIFKSYEVCWPHLRSGCPNEGDETRDEKDQLELLIQHYFVPLFKLL
jgi:hypothetical protein